MWFVMCDASRAVTLTSMTAELERRRVKLVSVDDTRLVAEDAATGHRVRVGVSDEPHVSIESEEIAGKPFGHRYEIAYPLEHGPDLINTILAIAEELAAATGGVVYDAASGEVVP